MLERANRVCAVNYSCNFKLLNETTFIDVIPSFHIQVFQDNTETQSSKRTKSRWIKCNDFP